MSESMFCDGGLAIRIGELARRTGVAVRLLRYYEQQGLLSPRRLPSGYRVYDEGAVERVGRIRVLLAAGLSTCVIARVLPCVREGDSGSWLIACEELRERLSVERERIDGAIEAMVRTREILDGVLAVAEVSPA
ncbi:MerR family transcriptional regulator [Phytomonospora sp. NPDC050363]|uniref:MerR family transcriptional regulator n=1 Tax=Phytomonospora sp. NPDC050363 TaxID=3155642 RepID=UPI0033F4EAFD